MNENTPAPYYSLFFELAAAVAGTLLVVLFCSGKRGKKAQEEEKRAYLESQIADGNNNQESDKVRKRIIGSKNNSVKNSEEDNTDPQRANDACNETLEAERTQNNDSHDVTLRVQAQTQREVTECTHVNSVAKATQTDTPLEVDDRNESKPNDESHMAIMWKGVLVNGNDSTNQMRYRTELHMKIDGAITHCESIRKQGFVGAGIDQVLIKVQ